MNKKPKQENIFKEAWRNMSTDFNKFMPEKLRAKSGKKKFVLWLFVLELVILGFIGKWIYGWLTS